MLNETRNCKMARSSHAYVRGNAGRFYEWLDQQSLVKVPEGSAVWICGDCHVGNLGPLADARGRVRIQIRDLDQTVIGNPAHDLIRLALSFASAARGSNLPGATTAYVLESIMDGYESAFEHDFDETENDIEQPSAVKIVMRQASKRTWKQLAVERIEDVRPAIPLGRRFWPLSGEERDGIDLLFQDQDVARLATMVRTREDDAKVEVVDAAYWMKGCSSLGQLRYAVLVRVTDEGSSSGDLCLIDIKEGVDSVAPRSSKSVMPVDNAQRVVEGARHVSPFLGERMRFAQLRGRSVFLRELMPQDLKIEFSQLSTEEAVKAAGFLAAVVGYAHARQMDSTVRMAWREELARDRSRDLDAPSWLWSSTIGLLVSHEEAYLQHCRRFVLTPRA